MFSPKSLDLEAGTVEHVDALMGFNLYLSQVSRQQLQHPSWEVWHFPGCSGTSVLAS